MTNNSKPEELKGEDWAGEMGLKWLANLSLFEQMIAPIGEALLARADYKSGENVIDLGCGGGATTLAIANTVAPSGVVRGVDISPDLVAAATERARQAGVANSEFTCADAAHVQLPSAPYDRLFSRFGSMFFEEPIRAFTNLHGLLHKGGRIDLAVWASPQQNTWMTQMIGVVRNYTEIPPAIPRAPGPFAFEDLDYLGEVLNASGFSGVDTVAYESLLPVGGVGATPKKATEFALTSMAVGRLLGEQGDSVFEAASRDLTDLFTRHYVPKKGVMMQAKAWLVTAST